MRGPDAEALLARALAGLAEVTAMRSERWAPATFTGMRHRATLRFADEAAAVRFAAAAADVELPIRGHILADLAVLDRRANEVEVAALTIEDA